MIKTPKYFINGQHRITVCVVGAGGNGSMVLTKLARFSKALNHLDHPGLYVKCVDFDVVEKHNVGRQMFTDNDIGNYKADALISKINMAFNFDWDCETRAFQKEDADCNILISCVDNLETRKEILSVFYDDYKNSDTTKKHFIIDCGNARDFGQVILSDYKEKLKNIYDLIPNWLSQNTVELQGEGCSYAERLNEQDLYINDWVSLYVVTIIKDLLFKKQIDYQGFFFNVNDYETQKIMI